MTQEKLFKVQEPKSIKDGSHKGRIIDVTYRTAPYEYTDLTLEFKQDQDTYKLKYGLPSTIYPDNKIGKLIKAFGGEVKFGEEINPYKIFVGKACEFMTMTKGNFANVVDESLKPIN